MVEQQDEVCMQTGNMHVGWNSACEDDDSEQNTEKSKRATCCCVINLSVAAQIHSD